MLDTQVATFLADGPRASVTTAVGFGSAPEVLLATAQSADLLVLGSHGHGRLFRAVLGSVADACIRGATCPVVVVPVPHPAELTPAVRVGGSSTGVPAASL